MHHSPRPATESGQREKPKWVVEFKPANGAKITTLNSVAQRSPIAITSLMVLQRIAKLTETPAEVLTSGARIGWKFTESQQGSALHLPTERLIAKMPQRYPNAEAMRASSLALNLDWNAESTGIKKDETGALFIIAEPRLQLDFLEDSPRNLPELEMACLFRPGAVAVIRRFYSQLIDAILYPNQDPAFRIRA